jgi:putative radical SAM enzyme (TIGR03279 family)
MNEVKKLKIINIDPTSPLFGHVRPGYKVVAINGRRVLDSIDFRYRTADERVTIRFADHRGRELEFQFDESPAGGLGLTLDDDKIRRCNCDCIFCFVHQQPKGLRHSLYIKDEDYRLSFTHGNFITLSNLTEQDTARIIEQRLSPLYVSVHTTDDNLRRYMLGNKELAPIIPHLRYLSENGITINTQVVLCPGINDGSRLEKTIEDLSQLYPGVETLAVVPVGLTRYRDNLPRLRSYTASEAAAIVDFIETRQNDLLTRLGTRFVWPADEFYVLAQRDFPARVSYEKMPQFENGVGMAREFITMFNRRRARLKEIHSDRRVLFLTGYSAHPFLTRQVLSFIRNELRLNMSLLPVRNLFWGETISVSGLLTGRDLLDAALKEVDGFDAFVLPPNCINSDDLFLDDMSLEQFQNALGKPAIVGRYNLAESIREIFI